MISHGGLAPHLSRCYMVANVDRMLEKCREYPEHDIANYRARIIAGLQEHLQLLNNI